MQSRYNISKVPIAVTINDAMSHKEFCHNTCATGLKLVPVKSGLYFTDTEKPEPLDSRLCRTQHSCGVNFQVVNILDTRLHQARINSRSCIFDVEGPPHCLTAYVEGFLFKFKPRVGRSEPSLPTTLGHEILTKYFGGPQELLITKSRGYKRYADRHAIRSDKRRNIDDGHVESLCQVSKRRSVITQINALAVHIVLKCARPMSESPSGASSTALGVSITE